MIGGLGIIGNAKYLIHDMCFYLFFCYEIKTVDMFKVHECICFELFFLHDE